jgi:hypothetical protein
MTLRLINTSSRIPGLDCSVIQKQWLSQELLPSGRASEVPDLQLLDLNCGAKFHDVDMPVEVMNLRKQVVMLCGECLMVTKICFIPMKFEINDVI